MHSGICNHYWYMRVEAGWEAGATSKRINLFSTQSDLSLAFQRHPIRSVTHRRPKTCSHTYRLNLSYQFLNITMILPAKFWPSHGWTWPSSIHSAWADYSSKWFCLKALLDSLEKWSNPSGRSKPHMVSSCQLAANMQSEREGGCRTAEGVISFLRKSNKLRPLPRHPF